MTNDPYNLRTLDHFGSNKYQWKVKRDILEIRSFARPGEKDFTPERYHYDLAGTIAHTLICDLLKMQEVVNVNINVDPGRNPFFGTKYEDLPFALASLALTLGHRVYFGGNPRIYSDDVDVERGVYVSLFRNFCNFIPEELTDRTGYWEFATDKGEDRALGISKMARRMREFLPGYSDYFQTRIDRAKSGYVSGECPFVLHPFDHLPVYDLSKETKEGYALHSVKEWSDEGRRIRCGAQAVFMHPTLDEPTVLDYFTIDGTEPVDATGLVEKIKKNTEKSESAPKVVRRDDAYTVQVGTVCCSKRCKVGEARCTSCESFAGMAGENMVYCKYKL